MRLQREKHHLRMNEMLEHYYSQASQLPVEVRGQVEKAWNGQAVILYAYVDLNPQFKSQEQWLVLGAKEIAYVKRDGESYTFQYIDRKLITGVQEIPGLSYTRLVLLSGDIEAPHLVLRYSHRQRRAVSNIAFILDQQAGNKSFNGETSKKVSSDEIYQESMLHSIKEAQASVAKNKFAVVFRLLSYLAPYKLSVAIGMGGALLMTAMALLPPFITGYLIDSVIKPFQTGAMSYEEAIQISIYTIVGLALTYVFREFFAYLRLSKMAYLGEYVAKDLRDHVYSHLQKLSLNYFSSKQTGSIISRVGSDTDRIWDFIAFGVVEVTTSIIMLIGLGSVLLYLDWRLGLLVVVPLPLILYMIFRHGEKMQSLFLRAWRKWSALTDCLSDTIPGIKVVKAFNREEYEVSRFEKRNDSVLGEFNRIHKAWTSFWPLLMLSIQAIILSVWIFGVPRVLSPGEEVTALSAGTFVSFVLYLTMFIQPIEIIGQMARMVNRATSSAHRVFEVLDTKPQIKDQGSAVKLEPVEGRVEFKQVSFSYDGVRQTLKAVSFDVSPGEMIGLVGPSGSGKTTLVNLLARFFDVGSGQILVDGVDLRDLESGHYRKQLGMVLQDPYLFHGTILENIRYAKPEASLDEIIQAAKAANAHDFIIKLPQAYDTMVGERGHTLSGGERQRLSIARAILVDPRILILDEATSAVDSETEKKIQDALDTLCKGRTVFAIAHRLSTLTAADRLLVMKDGRLVETGSHEELLRIEGGVYRKLFETQQRLSGSQFLRE